MKTELYKQKDKDTPYKAIGTIEKEKDGKKWHVKESVRFATREEALDYFEACKGQCLVSRHDFYTEKTQFIACKDK